jgi:hypothetical protein
MGARAGITLILQLMAVLYDCWCFMNMVMGPSAMVVFAKSKVNRLQTNTYHTLKISISKFYFYVYCIYL